MSIALIILAAGHGSRMKSDKPKVLHRVASAPLLWHTMRRAESLDVAKTVVVVGHEGEQVSEAAKAFDPDCEIVWQKEQNGTGHAVQQAQAALDGFEGDAVVLYGDTPFVAPETLERMLAARADGNDIVVLGFKAANPGGYGRLVMESGILTEIVEAKDASPEQLAIDFCNSGVICAPAPLLFSLLDQVGNDNASGEVYLTDIIGIANGEGLKCTAITCDEAETMGVNTRADLAMAEANFQKATRAAMLENGVTMTAPETVFFAFDTVVGRDTIIGPNVFFGPGVTVENNVHIRVFCHFEGCHISSGAIVGPFARLRPGTELGGDVKVGNFVEIKNAIVDQGAKVNHLSYVGDAHVGEGSNIGAGTIFCNYDGVNKHHTEVGKHVFVGSNSALVAPVTLGDEAFVTTGAVVTDDVPAGDMVFARVRQVTKKGLGKRFIERLRAAKK